MPTPDLQLRELRIWRLDHAGAALRVTRAPTSVASVAVLVGFGLSCVAVGGFGIFDVGFAEAGAGMPANERTFALVMLALLVCGGLGFWLAAWVMRDRERYYVIHVEPTGVHVRHGRFREDRIAAAAIERVEVIGRRFGPSGSRTGGARVDVILAPGPDGVPFTLAMWSLTPDSERVRAQLEAEARALAGQVAAYLGDRPLVWRGFGEELSTRRPSLGAS